VQFERLELANCDLSGCDLSSRISPAPRSRGDHRKSGSYILDLRGADFSEANLKEADFTNAKMSGARFEKADLSDANSR
jgi:uncharacterized protein YjbI with pentapeptide repeats